MTSPLPRIRKRDPVVPVVPTEAPTETTAPLPTRIRSRAAAPTPTRQAVSGTTSVRVERTFSDGSAPQVESNIQRFPVDIPEVHATVSVSGKISKEVGPGLWVSMAVGIWFPCKPTEEVMEETYLASSEWVERRLAREYAIANGDLTD